MPQKYPTRFPDCVGLVPNSTATTVRTVKALDTDSSSRRTGHNGLGTDSAGITILISFIHHTSVQSIGTYLFRHLSNIRIVPLGFCFISRLEGDQLNLLRASCNRRPSSVRIFQSSLDIYLYSACPARNSLSTFLSITNFEDNPSIQSLFDPVPYFGTTSAFLMSFLSLPHRATSFPAFVVHGSLPSAQLARTTAAPVGRFCGSRYTHHGFWRSCNCIWFPLHAHFQRLCIVFPC